jgi:anion-transporting  ArsA/GET3 family ATPase
VAALEHFNSYRAFFQRRRRPAKLVLDDVPEELLATPGASEEATFQDVVKLLENLLLLFVLQG